MCRLVLSTTAFFCCCHHWTVLSSQCRHFFTSLPTFALELPLAHNMNQLNYSGSFSSATSFRLRNLQTPQHFYSGTVFLETSGCLVRAWQFENNLEADKGVMNSESVQKEKHICFCLPSLIWQYLLWNDDNYTYFFIIFHFSFKYICLFHDFGIMLTFRIILCFEIWMVRRENSISCAWCVCMFPGIY
jgi:hypothetical protein